MHRRQFLASFACAVTLPALPARAAVEIVRLRDLYNKDLSFSAYAEQKGGSDVAVSGFMAPPLKAESQFFVLTVRPMAVCPFCDSEADWPDDIMAVYTRRTIDVVAPNIPIVVSGRLELGTFTDPETGFVSRVRLVEANFSRI